MVGTVGEAEVRAAVEHIEVERRAHVEHRHDGIGKLFRVADVVMLAPVVEPAAPVFAAHRRLTGTEVVQRLERADRVRAEVGDTRIFGQRTAGQHPVARTVGGVQLAVHAVFLVNVGNGVQVFLVIAVGAVFVLNLHHDDASAVRDQIRTDAREQLAVVRANLFKIQRIVAAQCHVLIGEQPRRQTAEFVLCADVGTGTDDDVQSELLRGFDVLDDVKAAGEVKGAFLAFVQVPRNIRLNRVEAARAELF